ncbi:MAG: S9 family peptidase [Pyrinomonadaceae bacterium]|nr:S9 family peptidase [Phycisphaerales bacterium]
MNRLSWIVSSVVSSGLFLAAGVSAQDKPAQPAISGAAGATAKAAPAQPAANLIPRSALFSNPDRISPSISPDGRFLAFIAPVNGVLNVWVGPVGNPDAAKPVTSDTVRGIRQYSWLFNNTHLLYLQDSAGDENWKIYATDVSTGKAKDLTPFEVIIGEDGNPMTLPNNDKPLRPAAQIQQVSEKHPDEILIAINNRNAMYHDVHRVNVKTGDMKLVYKNDKYAGIVTDDDYAIRFAVESLESGGTAILQYTGTDFKPFQTIGFEDALTTSPMGFDKSGKILYMIDSRGRNTAALKSVDLATGKEVIVAEDGKTDVNDLIVHPTEKTIQAVSFNYLRNEWKVLDKTIQPDLDYLKTAAPGEVGIVSRTLDDKAWVVVYMQDTGGAKYYAYDRPNKKATFLFSARKALESLTLAPMHPVVIKSRDGLDLVSYLTLPVGSDKGKTMRPDQPLPMILNVHGGPWARDEWGYRGEVQWQANRGYAVLQVNYRGSTGFGKEFINKADREWGGKMHDDLIDAVNWAVKEKIADPKRIAIYGGSYGGYATLVGMTFTPDTFACGVDIVGVANLNTFMKTIPPYWAPFLEQMKRRVGDFSSDEGRSFLASRSPSEFVQNIKKPLLIGQGKNDPRVNHDESQQIVDKMKSKNIPVTYVLFPDEGHGFARPQNRMAFYAVSEAFLAQHLGGNYEPINDDFKGSSITVPDGKTLVPGLPETIK